MRFYGLTRVSLRRLAFSFAAANGCQATFNQQNQMAGKEWTSSFCERHGFSLRVPEKCSLGRAIGFNAVQVSRFFDNLKEVYGKHTYPPSRIYNMDETGVSTVPNKVPKVYAEKGKRAVSKVVSADRGQLVTAVCCISASGLYVPPALIFPRKRKKEELYREAPPGTLAMISDSGYMNTDLFVEWLEHFQVFVKSSQEDPVLLILDNHVSHCSLGAIDTSRKYNICLVSLPPHASHKLQPLDVGFFGPFKTAYSIECDNWMVGHPGRPITHKEVAGLFRAAYYRVGNLERPINAFKATGIYPFRPTIFDEVDFLPSDVTYRPLDEAVPSISAPATRSSSPAHTVTRDPVTTPATPSGQPSLRISPTHNVTHDLLPTPATPTQATPLQATTLPATPLQATTLPAIPLQATTLPATPLQTPSGHPSLRISPTHNVTHDLLPTPATPTQATPLQATTLPATPLQATTLQAHPMSPGPSSSRVSPAQLYPFPKAITQGKTRKNARKSEILSGTPYKKRLTDKVAEQSAKTDKKRSWKKIIVEKRSGSRPTTSGRRGTKPVSCETSDDICNCPMCGEEYSDPPTEDWVQCDQCQAWWHEKCTDYGVGPFLCDNCMP